MDLWNEVRTAAYVLRLGTVSAAAEALGVHRATVIRHIDALEDAIGGRLFQRHARGYTPTDIGRDLARVAATTDDEMRRFFYRAQHDSDSLDGELIITSMDLLVPTVLPAIKYLRQRHRGLRISYRVSSEIYRLEYGEAHVAFRIGPRPDTPDLVVRPFGTLRFGLFASRGYVDQFGVPETEDELRNHEISTPNDVDGSMLNWLRERVPEERHVFSCSAGRLVEQAVVCGLGIGFVPLHNAKHMKGLARVLPDHEWSHQVWLVTHVDLNRTPKVQALVDRFKGTDEHELLSELDYILADHRRDA
ncbi:MAG: LysR family transcriptional regulator [Myxococcota bacterium]